MCIFIDGDSPQVLILFFFIKKWKKENVVDGVGAGQGGCVCK